MKKMLVMLLAICPALVATGEHTASTGSNPKHTVSITENATTETEQKTKLEKIKSQLLTKEVKDTLIFMFQTFVTAKTSKNAGIATLDSIKQLVSAATKKEAQTAFEAGKSILTNAAKFTALNLLTLAFMQALK